MRASSGRSTFSRRATQPPRAVLARSVLALSLLSAPCAWGADAPEPSAEQSATELKARADAAMDGGAYADAITSYRASYELSRNPALLYNIGNAYERLGDYPRALAYLEQFALVAPIGLRARVPALPELIASVRGRLARVAVGCNVPGARVLVRGSWQGTTPLTASISTMPGPARVEVVADGYQPFARDVVLSAGKETRFDAVLVSSGLFTNVSREAAPPAKDGGLTTKWWFWTGVGLVVAGGAAIAVVALTTNHAPPAEPSASHTQAALVSW